MSRKETKKEKKRGETRVAGGPTKALAFRPQGNPIPLFTDIVMRYADMVTIDAAQPPAVGSYQFRANGLVKPDVINTGHQPLGFDQWLGTSSTTGFYDHFLVVSSELKITLFSQFETQAAQLMVFLGLSDDTTIGTTLQSFAENPTYKHAPLSSMYGGRGVVTLKHKYVASKQFGLTREALYAREDLMGSTSTDPTEQTYYNIVVCGTNPAVNPGVVWIYVDITYCAHLTERREIAPS